MTIRVSDDTTENRMEEVLERTIAATAVPQLQSGERPLLPGGAVTLRRGRREESYRVARPRQVPLPLQTLTCTPQRPTLGMTAPILRVSGIFAERLCSALGPKLRALILTDIVRCLKPQLHLFSELRVLVLDDWVDGETLWQLKQLEFLHCIVKHSTTAGVSILTSAIRTLSAEHSLRKVSVEFSIALVWNNGWPHTGPQLLAVMLSTLHNDPTTLRADYLPKTFSPSKELAQLTMFACTGVHFSTIQFMQLVMHMQSLEHLELRWESLVDSPWNLETPLPPQLEVLKLTLYSASWRPLGEKPHPFLPKCSSVHTLELIAPSSSWYASYAWTTDLVTTNFPNVERLRVSGWELDLDWQTSEPSAEVTTLINLQKCEKLESLDLQLCPQVNLRAVLPLIQHLPHFRTLEVTSYPPSPPIGPKFELTPELYSTIAAHPAFHSLHVHVESLISDLPKNLEWKAEAEQPPSLGQILESLEGAVAEPEVMKRLQSFCLYQHRNQAPSRTFILQPVDGQQQLQWTETHSS
jgi:hypothetical protein